MLDAVEGPALKLDLRAQRTAIELHVSEVLEQDVVRLVREALELLAGQRSSVPNREVVDILTHDNAEVLQAHFVDALVDGWDELDHRDHLIVEDPEWLGQDDLGDRPSVPVVLDVGDRVAFDEPPHLHVLVPLGDPVREVHPAAAFMPRTRWLDVLVDYVMHDYAIEEQHVDVDGDVAAVLTRVRTQATVLRADRRGVFVISDTWRRRGDGWRVWRRHSSPLTAGEMPGA